MAGRENWCEMAGRKVALHSLWEGGWAGGDGDGVVRERTTILNSAAAASLQ